ncbi:MAG: diheme cytochrome c-553 [Acidobacteriota bacterium]
MKTLATAVCAALFVVGSLACQQATQRPTTQSPVERGRYLVTAGGCNDCHTPWKLTDKGPAPDMSRMLSGHPQEVSISEPAQLPPGPWGFAGSWDMTAWSGPWGVSFAANLTPDEETGVGSWSEQAFIQAMRTGKHLGAGRPILPPMPWPNLAQLTDDDLRAMFAYLNSIKPIANRVPDPIPPRAAAGSAPPAR